MLLVLYQSSAGGHAKTLVDGFEMLLSIPVQICEVCECHSPGVINSSNTPRKNTIIRTMIVFRPYPNTNFSIGIQIFHIGDFQMLTTRKQKRKARKSREADMLPDIENNHIMLGTNHFEREESDFSNFVRKPESPNYHTLGYETVIPIHNLILEIMEQGILSNTASIQEVPFLVSSLVGYQENLIKGSPWR